MALLRRPTSIAGRKSWSRLEGLMEAQGWLCFICGQRLRALHAVPRMHPDATTLEHFVPSAFGGLSTLPNLVVSHRRCNSGRQHKLMDEAQMRRFLALKGEPGRLVLRLLAAHLETRLLAPRLGKAA